MYISLIHAYILGYVGWFHILPVACCDFNEFSNTDSSLFLLDIWAVVEFLNSYVSLRSTVFLCVLSYLLTSVVSSALKIRDCLIIAILTGIRWSLTVVLAGSFLMIGTEQLSLLVGFLHIFSGEMFVQVILPFLNRIIFNIFDVELFEFIAYSKM